MKKKKKPAVKPPLARDAEKAMREAVDKIVEECKKNGLPIAIWKNGKSFLTIRK
ncbi:MAG: hypothetical protein HY401_05070 [Elusimicrobia bacterium]|nr:hypothetical protein [Elusimicrobiota bacterium]